MSGPRSAAGKSYRTGQHFAGLVASFTAMFGGCAFASGGWSVVQWVTLTVVLAAIGTIVFLQRHFVEAEARYAPRPPIVARPAGRTRTVAAPPRRLDPGPDYRTGPPADATRKEL